VIDAADFGRALEQFASGVTVVTTRDTAGGPFDVRPGRPLVYHASDDRRVEAIAARPKESGGSGRDRV
jgi:hypothetical protein